MVLEKTLESPLDCKDFDGLLINDKIGNFVFTRNLKFTKAPEQYCLAYVKMGMTETVSGA